MFGFFFYPGKTNHPDHHNCHQASHRVSAGDDKRVRSSFESVFFSFGLLRSQPYDYKMRFFSEIQIVIYVGGQ